jgi:hypothetical protein
MAQNAQLIAAAEEFTAAVKAFNGDPVEQTKLVKQADKLMFMVQTPMDVIMQQWEMVNSKTTRDHDQVVC